MHHSGVGCQSWGGYETANYVNKENHLVTAQIPRVLVLSSPCPPGKTETFHH